MISEQRLFDYRGFPTKKDWIKNKLKSFIGKGLSDEEVLKRRKLLVEYYKSNPTKLIDRDKSESHESFGKKIRDKRLGIIVSRRSNKLIKSIKKSGHSYVPGKAVKTAAMVATPLMIAPIPGTTSLAAGVIGAGTAFDKLKVNSLRKDKNVDKSFKRYIGLKKSIRLDEKIQKLQKKKLELDKKLNS